MRRGGHLEEVYSQGYDCGFRAGFIAGAESGYSNGYDDATRAIIEEEKELRE